MSILAQVALTAHQLFKRSLFKVLASLLDYMKRLDILVARNRTINCCLQLLIAEVSHDISLQGYSVDSQAALASEDSAVPAAAVLVQSLC